jgi:superfamily II DNA/RNA helicase
MVRSPVCPLCRASFHPSALKAIGVERPAKPGMPKKLDALLKIFQENEKGKFLVFSRYENPFVIIQENVQGLSVGLVQGNKDAIANKVADFEAGRLNILLMNSRHAAAGLNLPSATHIILLHRMIVEEEKQILGRAYRMGRTEPLQFIQLLHDKE